MSEPTTVEEQRYMMKNRIAGAVPPKLMCQKDYNAYLEQLTPANQLVSLAYTFAVNCAIIFGVSDNERTIFNDQQCRLLDLIHEGYQLGGWRPEVGSHAEFFVLMVEKHAGGKPPPELDCVKRGVILKFVFMDLFGMLQASRRRQNSLGNTKSIVPLSQANDPKRQKFLDDLEDAENSNGSEP